MNDTRMPNAARKGSVRPGGKGGGKGDKGRVAWHPQCPRCAGRHETTIECPNVLAIKRGFDATKSPGVTCNYFYKDRTNTCKGVGHLQADHAQAVAAALASGKMGNSWPGQGRMVPPKGSAVQRSNSAQPRVPGKGPKGKGKGKGAYRQGKGKTRSAGRLGTEEGGVEDGWEEEGWDPNAPDQAGLGAHGYEEDWDP